MVNNINANSGVDRVVTLTQTDISVWLAIFHGLLAFFSPCVLPLIPGFIGIILFKEKRIQRLFGFFIGFSFMFALLGAVSSTIGGFLLSFGSIIEKIIGIGILLFGIAYIFELQIFKGKGINIWRFKGSGFAGGLMLGAAIGFIWIPCSSPVLGSMLLIAAQKSILKGMWLLFVYSLGISIPFLTLGTLISKMLSKSFGEPKWEKWLRIIGGSFIVVLGILIISGQLKA